MWFFWNSDNELDLSEQAVTSGAMKSIWLDMGGWPAAQKDGWVQVQEAALNYASQRALAYGLSGKGRFILGK